MGHTVHIFHIFRKFIDNSIATHISLRKVATFNTIFELYKFLKVFLTLLIYDFTDELKKGLYLSHLLVLNVPKKDATLDQSQCSNLDNNKGGGNFVVSFF